MARIIWDQVGERVYETGVDHGVLYIPNSMGVYTTGVGWNGLTTITESPSGAEANAQYADNIKYLNLISAEEFAATLEAFTYPKEFEQFDGLATPTAGVTVGQQARGAFGLSYRTLIGNDTEGRKHGYKLHLVYGLTAAPSERANTTVNDSPEAMALSWALSASPVPVPGHDPSATLTIDSREVEPSVLAALEQILYGTAGTDPRLPMPAEVIAMFESGVDVVTPTEPAYNLATHTITIPNITGVEYTYEGEVLPAGAFVITEDVIISAQSTVGYTFPSNVDTDWGYEF